jgi:hypothetical protein
MKDIRTDLNPVVDLKSDYMIYKTDDLELIFVYDN